MSLMGGVSYEIATEAAFVVTNCLDSCREKTLIEVWVIKGEIFTASLCKYLNRF